MSGSLAASLDNISLMATSGVKADAKDGQFWERSGPTFGQEGNYYRTPIILVTPFLLLERKNSPVEFMGVLNPDIY